MKIPLKLNPFPLFGYSGARDMQILQGYLSCLSPISWGDVRIKPFMKSKNARGKLGLKAYSFMGPYLIAPWRRKFNGDINIAQERKLFSKLRTLNSLFLKMLPDFEFPESGFECRLFEVPKKD